MALENIATVFGPTIMKKQGETVMEMVKNTAVVNSIANDIVKYYKEIFEVSFSVGFYKFLSILI